MQIQSEKGIPTAEEAYNFFTFNFEPDPQEEPEKKSRKRQKPKKAAEDDSEKAGGEDAHKQEDAEADEDNQEENEDQVYEILCFMIVNTCSVAVDTVHILSSTQSEEARLVRDEEEDLFVIEQSSQDFLEVKKAEYVGYRKRLQQESELLFMPSFRTGILKNKKQKNS